MYAIYEHLTPYVYRFYPILGQVNLYDAMRKYCTSHLTFSHRNNTVAHLLYSKLYSSLHIYYPLTCVKCNFTSHVPQRYERERGWRVWMHRYRWRDSVAKTRWLRNIPGMVMRFSQECVWRGEAVLKKDQTDMFTRTHMHTFNISCLCSDSMGAADWQ